MYVSNSKGTNVSGHVFQMSKFRLPTSNKYVTHTNGNGEW